MCSPTCETHIRSDMCFPTQKTHIPSYMWEYVCSHTWETYSLSDMCSITQETHFTSLNFFFWVGEHMFLVIKMWTYPAAHPH